MKISACRKNPLERQCPPLPPLGNSNAHSQPHPPSLYMDSLLSSLTAWSSTVYQHVWWAFKFHPIASTTALVLSSLAAIKWVCFRFFNSVPLHVDY